MSDATYHVYLLECADGTFYTGITTDLERRVTEHNTTLKGARYTKARRPVKLAYSEASSSRSEAQKREYAVRTLSREEKQTLIAQGNV
ncbi:MAG: Excinuclease subunit domain protein [Parcubacteria group bacterium]|nr:Excinuclease subunit domain protein [Parcubacteria group bacterium]